MITLSLGSNLDETDIKEGDDVYFECDVTSHPEAYKVTWRRNVRAGERERERVVGIRIFRAQFGQQFMVYPRRGFAVQRKWVNSKLHPPQLLTKEWMDGGDSMVISLSTLP